VLPLRRAAAAAAARQARIRLPEGRMTARRAGLQPHAGGLGGGPVWCKRCCAEAAGRLWGSFGV